jgi:hypothetical protein
MSSFCTSRSTTTSMCACGLGELRHLVDRVDLAVDADPGVPLGRQLLEQRGVLALAAADDRREDLEACALGQLVDLVDDLLGGLRAIGRPQFGQCGCPIRAYSRRR